jgi:hypothetical protein
VQQVGRVVSLPQAAVTASVANEARAGMRIERKIPRAHAGVPQPLGSRLSAERRVFQGSSPLGP